MEARSLRLGEALSTSWGTIKRYPGLTIGGFLLYYGITLALGFIPILGSLASLFVTPPLWGGMMALTLNLVDNRNPKLEDLFSGFRAYWKWMGVYWLYAAICTVAMLPLLILVIVGMFMWGPGAPLAERASSAAADAAMLPVIAVVCLLALGLVVGLIWVTVTLLFVFYMGVETRGVVDAFYRAAAISKGRRLHLLGIMIVLGLIGLSGMVGLGVGVLFTMILSQLAMAAVYRQISPYAPPAPEPQPWPWPPQQWAPPPPPEQWQGGVTTE